MLPVVAENVSASTKSLFDLSALQSRVTILLSGDGRQHVLLQTGHMDLQLVVSGEDILQPVRLRVDAIWPSGRLRQRFWALESLNSFCSRGELPERLFPPEKRGQRLRFVLQALDGALAQASHREIARVLIGNQRVDADWKDPGNYLQDPIRRAIRRGRSLMNGGYRDFLN